MAIDRRLYYTNPPSRTVPFATKSNTYEVGMLIVDGKMVDVVLRNTRTNAVLRRGRLYLRSSNWYWERIPKGMNLPPNLQTFAQDKVLEFINTLF